jgi:hypothetical protein
VVYWSEFLAIDPWVRVRSQIFLKVVGLERGPLNLMSTTEELLERKSNEFGLENPECDYRDPLR